MRYGILFLSTALLCVCAAGWAGPGAGIEVGVAMVDITPDVGGRMSGGFSERLSTGVHDPLQAKALVLNGDTRAAIVCCDVIGVPRDVARDARERAAAATGIAMENILVAGTHTHTGPLYFGARTETWHEQAMERDGADPAYAPGYPERLAANIALAVQSAAEDARPAVLEVMTAEQEGLSFNRRFHMQGGGPVRFNPGKRNPNIVRPAGPIDPDVGFLLARDAADNTPFAALTVFALHLDTVGGTEYAADFPYYLERTLRRELGDELISLFGNGPCGDINHVDVSHPRRQRGTKEAARIGVSLGTTILAALDDLKRITAPDLAVRHAERTIPLQTYTNAELDEALALTARAQTENVPFLDRVAANTVLKLARRGTDTLTADVQVFRISGDVAIVGLPGEILVDLGLAIKAVSPFAHTLVIELANGYGGYIPTEKAFEEGSYETVNCVIQPGGGEELVATAQALLREAAE